MIAMLKDGCRESASFAASIAVTPLTSVYGGGLTLPLPSGSGLQTRFGRSHWGTISRIRRGSAEPATRDRKNTKASHMSFPRGSRILFVAALLLPLLSAQTANTLTEQERKENYRLLFDGKSLDHWKGDMKLWSARDGKIVGSTHGNKIPHNSFLISKEKFSDFILRLEVNVRNHNSGVQFRSEELPDWVVRGYQADAAEGAWWGSIYGEKTGRGIIVAGYEGKGEKVVNDGGWNSYEIICRGQQITVTLNGLVTADLEDSMSADGILGLQLHAGPPMEAWFRNIRIRSLD